MKKYFALGMVAIFLLGFFLGRETSSNSPSPSIQTPLTMQLEASINKTDSVQTKTDVQCFVEALIISIYPNTERNDPCQTIPTTKFCATRYPKQ